MDFTPEWKTSTPIAKECTICYTRMLGYLTESHHKKNHPDTLYDESLYEKLEFSRPPESVFEPSSIPSLPTTNYNKKCEICDNIMPSQFYDAHFKRKHENKKNGDNATKKRKNKRGARSSDDEKYDRNRGIDRETIHQQRDANAFVETTHRQHDANANALVPNNKDFTQNQKSACDADEFAVADKKGVKNDAKQEDSNHEIVTAIDDNCANNAKQPETVICNICQSTMPRTAYERHLRRKHANHGENQIDGNIGNAEDAILTETNGDEHSHYIAVYYCEEKLNRDLLNGLITFKNRRFYAMGTK